MQKCVKDDISCSFSNLFPLDCPSFLPFRCSFDGSCRNDIDDCPTAPFCPLNIPFYCFNNGQCQVSKSNCPTDNYCPKGMFLCQDGNCSTSGFCGTQKTCTETFPIKCIDGSCRKSPEDCEFFECPHENQTMCHFTSSCISNYSLCQNVSSCPIDSPIKCPNDDCVSSHENCDLKTSTFDVHSKKCENQKFKCPGGLCVDSKIECPSYNILTYLLFS